MKNPFRYFKTSPEIIRLAVMMYVRFPLSLRNVEDLLHERGIEVSHGPNRFWWNRFGPIFAADGRQTNAKLARSRIGANGLLAEDSESIIFAEDVHSDGPKNRDHPG